MRSAPTLKIWMMPFSSVAMIEKLALVRIAFCSAPALSSRDAFWRRASLLLCVCGIAAFFMARALDSAPHQHPRMCASEHTRRSVACARLLRDEEDRLLVFIVAPLQVEMLVLAVPAAQLDFHRARAVVIEDRGDQRGGSLAGAHQVA